MTDQPPEGESGSHSNSNTFGSSPAPPSQSQEQNVTPSLEPFYTRLQSRTYTDSAVAIQQCRALCAEFGFTVKQEASTHKNIYIFCSREGLPDSQRNPRGNPKRNRQSKRCDCRWRVVLSERDGVWRFRKSLNPEAAKHNHELMRPQDIETSWPKQVTDDISNLAKQRLQTSEIRTRIQAQYPNIPWNERRFYNRLSEARQKIKQEETAARARRLTSSWARVCMAAAGSEEISRRVEDAVQQLLEDVCRSAGMDPSVFNAPAIADETEEETRPQSDASGNAQGRNRRSLAGNEATEGASSSQAEPSQSSASAQTSKSHPAAPKGYMTVDIPAHWYFVKVHNQRKSSDAPIMQADRRRSLSMQEEDEGLSAPARKLSRPSEMRAIAPNLGQAGPSRERQYAPHPHHAQNAATPTPTQPTTSPPFLFPPGYPPPGVPLPGYVRGYQPPYNAPGAGPAVGEMQLPFNSPSSTSVMQHPGGDRAHPAMQPHPMIQPALQHQQQQQQPSQQPPQPEARPPTRQRSLSMFRAYRPPGQEEESAREDWSG